VTYSTEPADRQGLGFTEIADLQGWNMTERLAALLAFIALRGLEEPLAAYVTKVAEAEDMPEAHFKRMGEILREGGYL